MPDGSLPGFEASTFTHDGVSRQVFRAGTGPAVIVIHEVPGLHPEAIAFGRRVIDAGFTVYMPSLFGTPGKPFGWAYTMRSLAGACVAREFVDDGHRPDEPDHQLAATARCRRARRERWARGRGGRHVLHRRVRARDDGRRDDAGARAQPTVAAVLRRQEAQGVRRDQRRRLRAGQGASRGRRVRARASVHRRPGRPSPSASRPCDASWGTRSSRSRSTRHAATRMASGGGRTRCSPSTSSTSPVIRPEPRSSRSSRSCRSACWYRDRNLPLVPVISGGAESRIRHDVARER